MALKTNAPGPETLKPVIEAMFGISPSKATVRYGLLTAIVGVPAGIHAILPLSVRVRLVPPVLSKVGVPAQVKTLPT